MVLLAKNNSTLSGAVSCPVCGKLVPLNKSAKVRVDGEAHLTISNYQRHIRTHVEKSEEYARTRKEKRKSRARSSQTLGKGQLSKSSADIKQRLQNDQEEESILSSDSDDNGEIEKQMLKNFEVAESDVSLDLSLDEDNSVLDQCIENIPPSQLTTKKRKVDYGPDQDIQFGKLKLFFVSLVLYVYELVQFGDHMRLIFYQIR